MRTEPNRTWNDLILWDLQCVRSRKWCQCLMAIFCTFDKHRAHFRFDGGPLLCKLWTDLLEYIIQNHSRIKFLTLFPRLAAGTHCVIAGCIIAILPKRRFCADTDNEPLFTWMIRRRIINDSDPINEFCFERTFQTRNAAQHTRTFYLWCETNALITVWIRTIPLQRRRGLPQGTIRPTDARFFRCCCCASDEFLWQRKIQATNRGIQPHTHSSAEGEAMEKPTFCRIRTFRFGTLWILYFRFIFCAFRFVMIHRKEALFSVSANNRRSNMELIPTIYIAF